MNRAVKLSEDIRDLEIYKRRIVELYNYLIKFDHPEAITLYVGDQRVTFLADPKMLQKFLLNTGQFIIDIKEQKQDEFDKL